MRQPIILLHNGFDHFILSYMVKRLICRTSFDSNHNCFSVCQVSRLMFYFLPLMKQIPFVTFGCTETSNNYTKWNHCSISWLKCVHPRIHLTNEKNIVIRLFNWQWSTQQLGSRAVSSNIVMSRQVLFNNVQYLFSGALVNTDHTLYNTL